MTQTPRAARADEVERLWPAARAGNLFAGPEEFGAYHHGAPWSIRVTERGAAAVLGVWRDGSDVLEMRAVWCAERQVASFVADARSVARELGLARVLSPLLPIDLLGGYRRQKMELCKRIVAIQGPPESVVPAQLPAGTRVRPGTIDDVPSLVRIEAESFDPFWRYGPSELANLALRERLTVVETDLGELIGYTLATASRGATTLGRLAVAATARGHGVGRVLVADVANWAVQAGTTTLSLCTQEENTAARALYAAAGLREVDNRYGLMVGSAREGATDEE